MKNKEVAKLLQEIGDLLDIMDVRWEPQAFRRAAQTVEGLGQDIADFAKQDKLEELPGIGKGIAAVIKEYLKKGSSSKLKELKKQTPIKVEELIVIEGLGPKRIKLLYKKLGIKNRKQLELAIKQNKVAQIKGLGKKLQDNISDAIGFVKTTGKRTLFTFAAIQAEEIISYLKENAPVKNIEYAGSLRRGKSTIGDIDILATSKNTNKVMEIFTNHSEKKKVLAKGPTKSSMILKNGMQVDLRVLPDNQWGAGLMYFTGSKQHNIALRKIAIKKGLKLSEYGVFKNDKVIAAKTEEQCYKALGLNYIPAELRENTGEIEFAKKKSFPKLIEFNDIKGDCHMHTKASDGANTIEEMAKAAKVLGLKYCVITDHTNQLQIARGLKGNEILNHVKAIKKVNETIKGFTILAGVEANIDVNGELDVEDKILKKLDLVVGSIHSGLTGSKDKITKRILNAMENKYMHILGHPTGRLLNKRPSYTFDVQQVFSQAKKTRTAFEIDCQPARLDLPTSLIKKAKEMNIKMTVSSDAHATVQIQNLKYGIIHARRGGLQKKDILNTMSAVQLKSWAKKKQ